MRTHARTTISLEHKLLQEIDDYVKLNPEYKNRSHLIKSSMHEFFRKRNAAKIPTDEAQINATITGLDAKTIITWMKDWGIGEEEAVRKVVSNYIDEHLERVNQQLHKRKQTCGEAPEVSTVMAPEGKGKE
jgi:Arc/MetJ-type ribon-helix-helix transcriptional regulator